MNEKLKTDILIIGAGPGGYVAAIYAAKKGKDVILVDGKWVGGTCLNEGCIPTKALVHSAELFQEILNSEHHGISLENPTVNLEKIIENKDKIKDKLVEGIKFLLKKYNVKVIEGFAKFLNDHEVSVDDLIITAEDIIIATGSMTKHLPIEGINYKKVWDSEQILNNKVMPKTLTIIGGGIIGMEFAFIYANLGVKVTVVEFLPRILPTVDKDIALRLIRFAKQVNVDVVTQAQVLRIEEVDNDFLRVHYKKKEQEEYIDSEYVLEAVGRGPNMENLGLENTSIEYDRHQGIKVNKMMKTNVKNIYAIGDVTNIMQLAHVASHQGIVAIDNILGKKKEMNYDVIPWVVFTSPPIAIIGISEDVAKEKNIDYDIVKTPYSANGKALILEAETGFIKLLRDKQSKQVIGATIFGKEAENLIATYTLAITNNFKTDEIKETVFAHPTIQELVHESALGLDKEAIHFID